MHAAPADGTSLFTEPTPEFHKEMRRRVEAHFRARGLTRHGGARLLTKCAFFLAGAATCYALLLRESFGPLGMWLTSMALGMFLFLFAMNSAHDASHNAIFQSRRWNKIFCFTYDLVGVSSWVTNLNHLRSHHVAPNVDGIDIAVGTDVRPTFRLHPDVPREPWHAFQHLYFPIAYGLSTIHKWFILDYVELARNSFGNRRGHPEAPRQLALLFFFKALTVTWALAVPLLVLRAPWWHVIIGMVSMHFVPGAIVGLTFQLTHISDGNEFPSLQPDGKLEGSSALHILRTNSDLVPQNRFVNWFSGGLNVHVTHHLFPDVSHVHLPDLAPVVEQVAQAHGVPYRKHATILDGLRAHVRILRKLGQPKISRSDLLAVGSQANAPSVKTA
jgi:linoleoyl-CoA desaturase